MSVDLRYAASVLCASLPQGPYSLLPRLLTMPSISFAFSLLIFIFSLWHKLYPHFTEEKIDLYWDSVYPRSGGWCQDVHLQSVPGRYVSRNGTDHRSPGWGRIRLLSNEEGLRTYVFRRRRATTWEGENGRGLWPAGDVCLSLKGRLWQREQQALPSRLQAVACQLVPHTP